MTLRIISEGFMTATGLSLAKDGSLGLLGFYDQAVEDMIRTLFTGIERVVYAPTTLADKRFVERFRADGLEQVAYPFSSYYRETNPEISNERYNKPSGNGIPAPDPSRSDVAMRYKVVQVTIPYHVDVWGERKSRINAWQRDWLLRGDRLACLTVKGLVPGADIKSPIVGATLSEESDMESETEKGRIYRLTLGFNVEGVLISGEHAKVIQSVNTNIHIKDS